MEAQSMRYFGHEALAWEVSQLLIYSNPVLVQIALILMWVLLKDFTYSES